MWFLGLACKVARGFRSTVIFFKENVREHFKDVMVKQLSKNNNTTNKKKYLYNFLRTSV